MAEHDIRALREYSQSLENQNIALKRECRTLNEQLQTLSNQYEQLSLAHAGCHNVLVQREHDMIKMQENNRIEQQHLYDQLKKQEVKNRMETAANISQDHQTRIQPTPLHLSFGGLNNVLESRLEQLNIGRADVMEEHIQRVVEFRHFLAGTMEELHQYRESNLQEALKLKGGEATPPKQPTKDGNVQTDPHIDQDIERLIRMLKEQEDKVNWLASQLKEKHMRQIDMARSQQTDNFELIRIEVHDTEDRLQFSTQLHIIDDDSEQESVDVLALGGPVRIQNVSSNNDFISEVENIKVRNRHTVKQEFDASQESTVKYNLLPRMQRAGTEGHSLSSLLRQLEIIIQTLQQRNTIADAQALLRIGVLLRFKAEELENVNLTISHYLQNTSQAIPVHLGQGAQRGFRWNPTSDDQWKTSLELLSGSRSKQSGHFRQQTSSIHSKFMTNRQRESTSFEKSRMSISGQLPSMLKKPNLTDLSAKISNLKQAHEQRRRKHCNMNRI